MIVEPILNVSSPLPSVVFPSTDNAFLIVVVPDSAVNTSTFPDLSTTPVESASNALLPLATIAV